METQELQIMDQPKDMIQFGKNAAQELVALVKQNNWSVNISGHDYLRFEAWQTVGRFFGYTIKTKSTKYVEIGTTKGFEATSVVLNSKSKEVGGAEALCLDDENNWKGKPLFSLKSMAQTRSGAKALRQVLAWVVVLAGFKPTPAEEVSEQVLNNPILAAGASEKQIHAIFAIAKDKLSWESEETKFNVKEYLNIESFNEMTKQQASDVIGKLSNGEDLGNTSELNSVVGYPEDRAEDAIGEDVNF